MPAKCEEIFHVNGVPGLARTRWMGHQLGANLPAAKPTGIGEIQRGAQWWRQVLALRSPRGCGDPQSGSSSEGSMERVGAEGGWGGMPHRGWLMWWAAVFRQIHAIVPLQAATCSFPGAVVPRGHPRPCWGWRCRSHWRAASPRQEHADLLSVSPRQAQRHPPGCSRHRWGLWHCHPGRISPLRPRGTILGHPLEPGVFYQCPPTPPPPKMSSAVSCGLSLTTNISTPGVSAAGEPRCSGERLCDPLEW